jgi:hypothetical protein
MYYSKSSLVNCTSAHVFLKQVNEFYLVYIFQLVALNLLVVYDAGTNNEVVICTVICQFV